VTSAPTPRVITQDLGGSELSRAAQEGLLTPEWYAMRPSGATSWREWARSVSTSAPADWLDVLLPAIAPTGDAAERLTRVARAGGVLVTTGQQPGLFGGALLTLAKALSAIALADSFERATGIPAAPLFWAATDDADFEESRSVQVAVIGGVETLRIEQVPPQGTPMSRAPLGDVSNELARLVDACGSVIDERVLELVRAAYVPNETVGNAYVSLLRALYAPLGMAVLDASHPATRRAATPVLHRALERAADVNAALERRAKEIATSGFHPQVDHLPGLTLVFTNADGVKRRIPVAEAATAVRTTPVEELSPNVLLRPVVERAIVPTIAYVAGPGEIAYFAQVNAVAGALGVAEPLAVPRWSTTILEPRVSRLLERLHVQIDDLRDPHAVESRIAHGLVPRPISDAMRELRRDVERDINKIEQADDEKLVPPASLQGLRQWMFHRLERLERRYGAAVKRREVQIMRDVATARAALFPEGKRQERTLAFVPFIARYGEALIREMLAHAAIHAERLVIGAGIPAPSGRPRAASRS
jgi:bacillithiol synthase